jgi:hypothetical protein
MQGKLAIKDKQLEESVLSKNRAEEDCKKWKAEVDRLRAEKMDADAL